MTISFTCAQCGAALKVDRDKAGRSGRCPRCGASIRVPEAQSESPARQEADPSTQSDEKPCPYCGETIKATATVCRFCRMNLETGKPVDSPAAPPPLASREEGIPCAACHSAMPKEALKCPKCGTWRREVRKLRDTETVSLIAGILCLVIATFLLGTGILLKTRGGWKGMGNEGPWYEEKGSYTASVEVRFSFSKFIRSPLTWVMLASIGLGTVALLNGVKAHRKLEQWEHPAPKEDTETG